MHRSTKQTLGTLLAMLLTGGGSSKRLLPTSGSRAQRQLRLLRHSHPTSRAPTGSPEGRTGCPSGPESRPPCLSRGEARGRSGGTRRSPARRGRGGTPMHNHERGTATPRSKAAGPPDSPRSKSTQHLPPPGSRVPCPTPSGTKVARYTSQHVP